MCFGSESLGCRLDSPKADWVSPSMQHPIDEAFVVLELGYEMQGLGDPSRASATQFGCSSPKESMLSVASRVEKIRN